MKRINVYIINAEPHMTKDKIADYFSGDVFKLEKIVGKLCKNDTSIAAHNSDIASCLTSGKAGGKADLTGSKNDREDNPNGGKDGRHDGRKEYIVIINNNSITNVTSDIIRDIMKALCTKRFDICYLCKWMDRCDLYSDTTQLKYSNGAHGVQVSKTYDPHGFQAVLISPEGQNKILKYGDTYHKLLYEQDCHIGEVINKKINSGECDAICVTPNLFDFDISKAVDNADYVKTIQCAHPGYPASSDNSMTGSYVVLALLILLAALALYFIFIRL